MPHSQFNLTTHHRSQKTGQIIRVDAYKLVCSKIHGDVYERPPGSGLCYFADGTKAPTSAEIHKMNEANEKQIPRQLTTADVEEIQKRAILGSQEQVEKLVRAKWELELAGRINDLVAARLTDVLPKMNITGEDAERVTEAVVPKVTVSEPEKTEAGPAEADVGITSDEPVKVTEELVQEEVSKPFKPAAPVDPAPVA